MVTNVLTRRDTYLSRRDKYVSRRDKYLSHRDTYFRGATDICRAATNICRAATHFSKIQLLNKMLFKKPKVIRICAEYYGVNSDFIVSS